MRLTTIMAGLIWGSVLLLADEHSSDFDRHTDFTTFKTFALREGQVSSEKPELNSPLVVAKVGDAIRAELKAKGLKETTNRPDLIVDYSITGVDYSTQRGGPAAFSEGTLVIDLMKRDSKTLVWRGVYRDSEKNNAKLAQKLPGDVKKSLAKYPPKQSRVIEPAPVTLPETPAPITAKTAAAAALEIVQTVSRDTAYLGPSAHPGLGVSLSRLERAARAVYDDNGRNPAVTATRTKALFSALQDTEDYAAEIANRPSETPESKDKSRALASKLKAISRP